jgi:hypothetical protein
MALTKVSFSMITGAPVNVIDKGADPTGVTDSTQAIKDALAESPSIWFPAGTYLVSETIRSQVSIFINGEDNVTIKAVAPFTGITVTDALTGNPVNLKAIFAVFTGTRINDITGSRIAEESDPATFFGKVSLDCDSVADYGVFIERVPHARIESNVWSAGNTGIWVGVYSWGVVVAGNKIFGAVTNGIYLGDAANGVSLESVSIWGYPTRTQYGIQSNGNNNGVNISGGFVERCVIGAYVAPYCGPHNFVGIDFEDITTYAVKVEHNDAEGRVGGPILIQSCYVDSIEENVNNISCRVMVNNCRMRAPATTSGSHYLAANAYSLFVLNDNLYDSGGSVVPENLDGTDSVTSTRVNSDGLTIINKRSNNSDVFRTLWGLTNYASPDQPTLITSSESFQTRNEADVVKLHTSKWVLRCNQTQTIAGVDSYFRELGIEVWSYGSGGGSVNGLIPSFDNNMTLGDASNRWSEVFAVNGTINTSDANEKQQIRDLDTAELAVAKQLKSMVKAFKWNDAVDEKGDDARIHVGVIAQDVAKAFTDNGLNPEKYSIFCRDVWYTVDGERVLPEEAQKEGVVAVRHERLGVRYVELFAFIIAAI